MSDWTERERGCCFGTCGGDARQHVPHEDQGCAMFEDTLRHLAPFVAERERQAAARALREAAGEMERIWVHERRTLGMASDHWLRERADHIERRESS